MKKIYNKKGFTLVECVIAIAVFAVMTAMILLMISWALQTAKTASENEKDLVQLVELVEEDGSVQRFSDADPDPATLKMKFGGTDLNFSVTYNTINGFRNYITCPHCGYQANNTDFLYHIYDTQTYIKSVIANDALRANKITYWFEPSAGTSYAAPTDVTLYTGPVVAGDPAAPDNVNYLKRYWCPKCENMLSETEVNHLHCFDCDNTASPYDNSATGFRFDNTTGTFICNQCNGTNIMENELYTTYNAETNFSVSGISPNAIRVGTVEKKSNLDAKGLITGVDGSGSELTGYSVQFTKAEIASTLPERYTIRIYNITAADADPNNAFEFELPPGYKVIQTGDPDAKSQTVMKSQNCTATYTKTTSTNTLKIKDVSKARDAIVEFCLVNEKTGLSFDVDYSSDGGLATFWFKLKKNTNTTTFPRDDDEMKSDYNDPIDLPTTSD